jgi:hypothetical protein
LSGCRRGVGGSERRNDQGGVVRRESEFEGLTECDIYGGKLDDDRGRHSDTRNLHQQDPRCRSGSQRYRSSHKGSYSHKALSPWVNPIGPAIL